MKKFILLFTLVFLFSCQKTISLENANENITANAFIPPDELPPKPCMSSKGFIPPDEQPSNPTPCTSPKPKPLQPCPEGKNNSLKALPCIPNKK